MCLLSCKTKIHVEYGIIPLSLVPVRARASDESEMVTQLLFGEGIEVLSARAQWRHIRCLFDDYEGWIDEKQYVKTEKKVLEEALLHPAYSLEISHSITNHTHHIPVVMGSFLPYFDGINLKMAGRSYWYNGQAYTPSEADEPRALLEKIVLKYHYAPYLWGGRSPFGIDCSGLTQMVYKILGVALPRDARQQADHGREVAFASTARSGDLAFFSNKNGDIAHVGIVLKDKRIIHAYGRVRIDRLDQQGIYNEELQKYTHQLRIIRRIF